MSVFVLVVWLECSGLVIVFDWNVCCRLVAIVVAFVSACASCVVLSLSSELMVVAVLSVLMVLVVC